MPTLNATDPHKLLDKGVFGISDDRRIMVSRKFVARSPAGRQHVLDLAGQAMIGPQRGTDPVDVSHIRWHAAQVFKDEGRIIRSIGPARSGPSD